jgi:hypothetical protein
MREIENAPAMGRSPKGAVIRFPTRKSAIWIIHNGPSWLVVVGNHGWEHGTRDGADRDAAWLAKNLNLQIRVAP